MVMQTYFGQIKLLLDRISTALFVVDLEVAFDVRSSDQGYLHGVLVFRDHSSLHFREFLDSADDTLVKVMYSYHYQDEDQALVFRYDNALHRPELPFIDHKHIGPEIVAADPPHLQDVLIEIVAARNWAT